MTTNSEVFTFGESMVVGFPPEPTPLEEAPSILLDIGGAESNVSIALSRLGHRVTYCTKVGKDPFARVIEKVLEREGVRHRLLVDEEARTGLFFREWLPDGSRRVHYYRKGSAASRLEPRDIPEDLTGASIVHLTGITPALSPSCREAVLHCIELAHARGCRVTFDPNFRPQLWSGRDAFTCLQPMMAKADVLLIGDEEALALCGTSDAVELHRSIGVGASSALVVKRGSNGSSLRAADGCCADVPPCTVKCAVDPVGAGDGFAAGFLSGLLQGSSLEECARKGNFIGARAVETVGDYHGYPSEAAWKSFRA